MVLAEALDRKLKKMKQERWELEFAEGYAEGRAEAQALCEEWRRLLLEAQSKGETFNVPPPWAGRRPATRRASRKWSPAEAGNVTPEDVQARWERWNRLRFAAREEGEDFSVPPPTLNRRIPREMEIRLAKAKARGCVRGYARGYAEALAKYHIDREECPRLRLESESRDEDAGVQALVAGPDAKTSNPDLQSAIPESPFLYLTDLRSRLFDLDADTWEIHYITMLSECLRGDLIRIREILWEEGSADLPTKWREWTRMRIKTEASADRRASWLRVPLRFLQVLGFRL